jgi:hypothetical protein
MSDIPSNARFAAASYAQANGLSLDTAWERLQLESRLVAFAERQRSMVGFAGFMLEQTAAGPVGVLALASSAPTPAGDSSLPLRLVTSRLTEQDARALDKPITSHLRQAGWADVAGVAFDSFSDCFTVWRSRTSGGVPSSPSPSEGGGEEALGGAVRGFLGQRFADVRVRVDFVRGLTFG